jgi:hypothetical protein
VKRALAAVAVLGVLLAGAAPAEAQTPLERKVEALQRRVAAQQRKVRSLETQVARLRRQANTTAACPAASRTLPEVCLLAIEGLFASYCTAAIAGDAFQTTWQVINAVGDESVMLPAIQPLNDQDLCGRGLRVNRQPALVPPTISPFQQMLARLALRPAPYVFWPWHL